MDILLLMLGIGMALIGGFAIHAACNNDIIEVLLGLGFVCILVAFICLFGSIDIAVKNSSEIVEALNGTLEYDTISLDKNGKLLEIKIK